MITFHIVWYTQATDFYSTGRNYSVAEAEQALIQWRKEFPTGIFKAMYTTN